MLTPTLNLPTITQEVALNTIRFNRNLGQTQTAIARFAKGMTDVGISLSLAISIPLQLIAASAVKSFATMDDAVTRAFSRVRGASEGVKVVIMNTARTIATQSKFTAAEVAGGMDELIKAGFNVSSAIKGIRTVMDFATAGELEMGRAAETLADILTTFRLKTGEASKDIATMSHISDVLVVAATESTSSVEQLTEALTHQGAAAGKIMGKSLEETVAVLATFHQAGTKGAAAGTKLWMMLRDITDKALEHKEVWEQVLGKGSVYDEATGQMRSTAEILKSLEGAMAGANDQQRRMLINMLELPSRSLSATLSLLGLSDSVEKFEDAIAKSGGATQEMARVQMTSLTNQAKLLGNQVRDVAYDIAQIMLPQLLGAGSIVQRLVFWWRSLSVQQKVAVVQFGAIAAAIGPFLIVTGMVIRMIGLVIKSIFLMTVGLVKLGVQLVIATSRMIVFGISQIVAAGPVGWLAAAIVGLIAVITIAAVKGEDFIKKIALIAPEVAIAALAMRFLIDYFVDLDNVMGDIKDKMAEFKKEIVSMTDIKGMLNKVTAGALDVDINPMKMKQAQNIYSTATNTAIAGETRSYIIEDAVKQGIISALEGKGLLDIIKMESEVAAQQEADKEFDTSLLETEEEKGKSSDSSRHFEATELGTEEEYRQRITGQGSMVSLGERQLAVQEKQLDASTDLKVIMKEVQTELQKKNADKVFQGINIQVANIS